MQACRGHQCPHAEIERQELTCRTLTIARLAVRVVFGRIEWLSADTIVVRGAHL